MDTRVALVVLAVLCLAGADRPDFCRGLDCPKYEQESRETYLIRTYVPSTWVSTGFRDSSFVGAAMRGAYRIYRYIWGYNEEKERLDMTAPISILVNESHAHCDSNCPRRSYLVSYFLPYAYQEEPPRPSSSHMCIVELPEVKLALIEFGGYPTPQHVWDKKHELHSLLKEAGVTFDNNTFLINVYDSPFHWSKRHNEVAVFLCKDQQAPLKEDGSCDTGLPNLDSLIPLAEDEPSQQEQRQQPKTQDKPKPEHADPFKEAVATDAELEEAVGASHGPSILEHYPHDVAGEKGQPHTHSSADPRVDKAAPPEYRAAASEEALEKELPRHVSGEHRKQKAPQAPPKVTVHMEQVQKEGKAPTKEEEL